GKRPSQVGVEVCVAGIRGRIWPDDYGDALSARSVQVESHRSSNVQPDQRELGWRTVAELRNNPETHSNDAFGHGISLPSLHGRQEIRKPKTQPCAEEIDSPETS